MQTTDQDKHSHDEKGQEPVTTIPEHEHDSDMNPFIGVEEPHYSRFTEKKTFLEKFIDFFK